ncbi:MAG: hypothetical protein ACREQV_02055 [Candidatus Binatia bacterium]
MADNTYHLCNLLSILTGPEEVRLADSKEEDLRTPRYAPAKL